MTTLSVEQAWNVGRLSVFLVYISRVRDCAKAKA